MVDTLSSDETYFKTLLKLACISSSIKIHNELHGRPERVSRLNEECNPYWLQWDAGRGLVCKLVVHCRSLNVSPTHSHLWPLLNRYYQDLFIEKYEFGRIVEVGKDDFDSLCSAIALNNTVHIDGSKLIPRGVEEASGHYGEEVFWRIWLLKSGTGDNYELHTDSYSLAEKVFSAVNGRCADENDYGESSKKLKYYCRSVYD
ncbi:hypothetical protein BM525_21155 (plasmid) [Alteromonas mediterranea]|uniref:Uncharacterized protein n=1 Tax=Alteromonas mediterranea TaxID=314275 RepID=A0AAC9JE31_9ALTE|nr:hypothetical protein [Alteromonas mediterranea]APD92369.1 hypothetical protein BM524_20935 [Alteromonas mediterranea]APE00230.1 hypothetical protein BM525_21155 [Alteromonas mediterranea]